MDPTDNPTPALWPERPTCHGARASWDGETTWQQRDAYRRCSYCGSLHPEDLLTLLEGGYTLGGSDWKYGYPHKFYVNNVRATDVVAPHGMGKFYTDHFKDQGYAPATLTRLLQKVTDHSGIYFTVMADGQIGYRAPYHGFQK